MTYRPEYYSDIPAPESDQDNWYATTVLECILFSYRYSCPDLFECCWAEYEVFCRRHKAKPGELSPVLGVFFNGWKRWFIGRYIERSGERAIELMAKLKNDSMWQELDFWHHYSLEHRLK
jgi:hypothetical protein